MTIKEENLQYRGALTAKLKKNWVPLDNVANRKVAVIYKVSRDGSVSGIRLGTASGLARLDNAVIDTVRKSAPFDSHKACTELNCVSNWTGNDIETRLF